MGVIKRMASFGGKRNRAAGLKAFSYFRWSMIAVFILAGIMPVFADVPKVAVSIKPLQALVAAVMEGVETPGLIVQGAGSEHGYALKYNDARTLSEADIIFRAGPEMETFLNRPLKTLAPQAKVINLAQAKGIKLLDARDGGLFERHDHNGDGDNHGHDDKGDKHADLHFWLDPQNAKAAVADIADILSRFDPEHEAVYHANAIGYAARLDQLTRDVTDSLKPVRGRPFVVFHDAYQYFENRFDIFAVAAITVNPEQTPGAGRIAEIRKMVKSLDAVCIFSEPQFEPRLVETIKEGTHAKSGVLDPLGSDLKEGPDLYIKLIENLAGSLKTCLEDNG